jgi:GAF domain-containing protein
VAHPEAADVLQEVVDDLLAATGASRVTLRQDTAADFFPVTREALAPGTPSIRDVVAPNMPRQPVVLEMVRGHQVVQEDCLSAFDDPDFQEMLDLYGGMRAQIVTPVTEEGTLKAVISVHQLGRAREWTSNEIEACNEAAARVKSFLAVGDAT